MNNKQNSKSIEKFLTEYNFNLKISIGTFETGDISIHSISTSSPVFDTVLEKKVNESFTIGTKRYQIKTIS